MRGSNAGGSGLSGSWPGNVRRVHGVAVQGIDVDISGRCAHWRGPTDIVALRMRCCGLWVSCFACHEAVADHPAVAWPVCCRNAKAVLCGACGSRLSIAEYLDNGVACPRCAAHFNPGCARHHHLYFEMA